MKETTQETNGQGNVEINDWEVNIFSVESIIIPKHHPRTDVGNLESLVESLQRDGIQDPLLVYETSPAKYAVIDGTRRLKAFQEIGWNTIPCFIKKGISEAEASHLSYVKNMERDTLSVIEIAWHIKGMRDKFKFTLRELELKGYGSSATISNYLKLLELTDEVKQAVHKGHLSMLHGLKLNRLENPEEQERMAKQIFRDELSASQAEDHITRYMQKVQQMADDSEIEVNESVTDLSIPNVYLKDAANMSELPSGSVQCIVTGPHRLIRNEDAQYPSITEYWNGIRPVMEECSRVLADGGVIALVMPDNVNIPHREEQSPVIQLAGHKYQSFLKKNRVKLTDQIIWDTGCLDSWLIRESKTQFGEIHHSDYSIRVTHRFINIFRKNGDRIHPSNEDMIQKRISEEEWVQWTRSVWAIDAEEEDPNVFPEELVRRLIQMFTYEGETVLDPFLGTGTTVKVARELKREAFGYERDLKLKSVIMEKLGMTFEDKLENVQQTLKSGDWAPDLSEADDGQEAEEAIAEVAEATVEA